MPIEMDWGVFGRGIQDATRMWAGGILQKEQEKRTEAKQLRFFDVEAKQRKLEREREQQFQKDFREQSKVINMELAEYKVQLDQENFAWQQEREAKSRAMLGDFDMSKQLAGAMQSGNTLGMMMFQSQMNIINKLRTGATQEDFTEQELAGLQTLSPVAAAGAHDLLNINKKARMDLELGAARLVTLQSQSNMYNAMAKMYGAKGTGASLTDLTKATEKYATIKSRMNEILKDPIFREITERIQAGDKNISDYEIKLYENQQELYLSYQSALQAVGAEINTIFPGYLERGRTKREPPPPEPEKKEPAKWKKKVREAHKADQATKLHHKKYQTFTIEKLKKEAGLPAKTKVFTNIASLRKAGKLKVGMIVYHDKKLYRVISGKGQKWDLEEL